MSLFKYMVSKQFCNTVSSPTMHDTVVVKSHKTTVVLFSIIVAQFFGTSLWFAGNAILFQLQHAYSWPSLALGYVTSSTQIGFIIGTFLFAFLGVTDKYSPSKVFLLSSVAASLSNLIAILNISSFETVLVSRLLTGFFLAGIYPVGMKIASDWKSSGLGYWLGALVGALVLGTAFPHVLQLIPKLVDPIALLLTLSVVALAGGILLYVLVPDGPERKIGTQFSVIALGNAFKDRDFRSASFGYFGHMWELYAFWAFVPFIAVNYFEMDGSGHNAAWISFLVIGSGAVGCIFGGIFSFRFGSARVATYSLLISFCCCLTSPFIWQLPFVLFLTFMIVWGICAAADSPQFSALVAKNAPADFRGSAITMVICIGFAITIITIQLLASLKTVLSKEYLFLVLALGPALGLLAMRDFSKKKV